MRKFMLSSALLGALSIPAHAQDPFLSSAHEGDVRASTFIGQRLYVAEAPSDMTEADGAQADWKDVGEVNDVLMSRDGKIDGILIDIGGFLGNGEKPVALGMGQVKIMKAAESNELRAYVNDTKGQLEAMPTCEKG